MIRKCVNMADVFTKEKSIEIMSKIRSKNTFGKDTSLKSRKKGCLKNFSSGRPWP